MADDTPRERLEEILKTPYPADGEVWSAFLAALSSEFDDFESELDTILGQKFVETATGEPLNKIADIFELDRHSTESLDEFRARIKAALRSQITSATLPEIREVAALLLESETDAVPVEEPFHLEPTSVLLDVGDELQQVAISDATFIDVVESVVAAGVQVGILVSETHSETVAIDDIGVAGDEVDGLEVLAIGDSSWNRTDAIQQGVWNEGRYDLDFWNTALQEFSVTETITLAIADIGVVDGEPAAIETAAVADAVDARIEAVQIATWNEGRVNIDGYA